MAIGKLERFNPPAYLDDFDQAGLESWDQTVEGWINTEIAGEPGGVPRQPLTQFFNPKQVEYDLTQTPVVITWLRMSKSTDDARWSYAENNKNQANPLVPGTSDREMMDEYCEWSTLKCEQTRDVIVVSFTCEGPEYWSQMATLYPIKSSKDKTGNGTDKILNLYKDLNPYFRDQIVAEDLVDDDGMYDPLNKWNGRTDTGSIAHLIQRNNALSAEVDIGAQATVMRRDLVRGELITNVIDLCGNGSAYGNAQRNSDPTIGGEINTLARLGVAVSIADPIALYFHTADFASFRLDPTGLRRGDANDMVAVPQSVFQFPRGDITRGQGLHIKVQLPPGMKATKVDRDLNVSDLFDLNNGGQYVRYGSQFADYIFVSVSGIVSASPPGVAPMQDSLTYTELIVPEKVSETLTPIVTDGTSNGSITAMAMTKMDALGTNVMCREVGERPVQKVKMTTRVN